MGDVIKFGDMAPKIMDQTWKECGEALERIPDDEKNFLIAWVEPETKEIKMNFCCPDIRYFYGVLVDIEEAIRAWHKGYLRVDDPFEEGE